MEHRRKVKLEVIYDENDVQEAADRMGISVTGAEAEAILANVDEEIEGLARRWTITVAPARIDEQLHEVELAHATRTEDD